jgi:hypothetical protein
MSVFISYSHRDKGFVDKLSLALLDENIKIWRDEHKMSPGDSVTGKIRHAIDRASFLCVVLSESAVASKWVQLEIDAGLLSESESSGLTIVPLLLQDCEIPQPLSDRVYVDFRGDFGSGLSKLLALVKRRYEARDSSGSTEDAEYFLYFASEEGWVEGLYSLELDVVSFDREERFCLLTQVRFRGNELATAEGLRQRGIRSPRAHILRACADEFDRETSRVKVSARQPAQGRFQIESLDGLVFEAAVQVKMLGDRSGDTALFNLGALLSQVHSATHPADEN